MNDLIKFSVDLRRIAYWIYEGQLDVAKSMLAKCRLMYKGIDSKIACYDDFWQEITKIERLEGGRYKAAERASTASVILLHESQTF